MAINVIVQYSDRSLPDNLLLTQAPIFVWFDGSTIILIMLLCYVWWLCMAINIVYSVTVRFSKTLYC